MAAVFVVLAAAALGQAQPAQQPPREPAQQPSHQQARELAKLMKVLAGRKVLEASFTETKRISMLTKPIVLRGTLQYRAPDYLKKQVEFPKPRTLVIDGDLITTRDGEQEERRISLREYPELRAFVESIRATLAGDAAVLRRYYRLEFQGNEQQWEIALVPLDQALAQAISRIVIQGKGADVEWITIDEANGDQSFMQITTTRR